MKKILACVCASAFLMGAPPAAEAQNKEQAKAEKQRKERQRDLYGTNLGRYRAPAEGPCPTVKVLWDAARYVEISGADKVSNVGFTGEFQSIDSNCTYRDGDPIEMVIRPNFAFGRGPQADGQRKQYNYFIAVTRKNVAVIEKATMPVYIEFQPGETRVDVSDTIEGIVIPRANDQTSGSNFEVLLGFELSPDQLAFNRSGKRFRANAGAQ